MPGDSPHEKGLLRVITFATAISFGILAAVAESMRNFVAGDATFRFSWRTLVAAALGCLAGWGFWRFVFYLVRKKGNGRLP